MRTDEGGESVGGRHHEHRDPERTPSPTVVGGKRRVVRAVVPCARVPDVVLPVLDEATALPGLLAAMPAGYRPIVVDNGSSDGSGRIARELGALVVDEARRGFGAACWAGLQAASADIVCFMDADGSLDPADLVRVAGPVIAGDVDLVLGARIAERGAWPLHARVANRYLARRLGRSLDVPLRDLGPMRAARRTDLLALGIVDRRFGWPLEMVVLASRRVGASARSTSPTGPGPVARRSRARCVAPPVRSATWATCCAGPAPEALAARRVTRPRRT